MAFTANNRVAEKNKLAEQSCLIVYSDGPKSSVDAPKISDIRKYIRTIDGFKNIEVVESSENLVRQIDLYEEAQSFNGRKYELSSM